MNPHVFSIPYQSAPNFYPNQVPQFNYFPTLPIVYPTNQPFINQPFINQPPVYTVSIPQQQQIASESSVNQQPLLKTTQDNKPLNVKKRRFLRRNPYNVRSRYGVGARGRYNARIGQQPERYSTGDGKRNGGYRNSSNVSIYRGDRRRIQSRWVEPRFAERGSRSFRSAYDRYYGKETDWEEEIYQRKLAERKNRDDHVKKGDSKRESQYKSNVTESKARNVERKEQDEVRLLEEQGGSEIGSVKSKEKQRSSGYERKRVRKEKDRTPKKSRTTEIVEVREQSESRIVKSKQNDGSRNKNREEHSARAEVYDRSDGPNDEREGISDPKPSNDNDEAVDGDKCGPEASGGKSADKIENYLCEIMNSSISEAAIDVLISRTKDEEKVATLQLIRKARFKGHEAINNMVPQPISSSMRMVRKKNRDDQASCSVIDVSSNE